MPRIDPVISVGNLLSIATVIIGVGIPWGQMQAWNGGAAAPAIETGVIRWTC